MLLDSDTIIQLISILETIQFLEQMKCSQTRAFDILYNQISLSFTKSIS